MADIIEGTIKIELTQAEADIINKMLHDRGDKFEPDSATGRINFDGLIRLEIGAGGNPQPGYIHNDIREMNCIEIVSPGWRLPLDDEIVSEIYCQGVFEHFSKKEAEKALREWNRVLAKNGTVDINVPDLYRWAKYLIETEDNENGISNTSGYHVGFIMTAFYGWQGHENDFHRYGWTKKPIFELLKDCGFVDATVYKTWFYSGENDAHLCIKARKE